MVSPSERALNMLKEQLVLLYKIDHEMENDQNWLLARYRLERWRERTISLIEEFVSKEESDRFADYDIPYYRRVLPLDDLHWLKGTINKFESLLIVLAEELQQQWDIMIMSPPKIQTSSTTEKEKQAMPDRKKVFVVYGRNTTVYNAMVLFLQALGLEAIDFYKVKADLGASAYVGDIVKRGMEIAQGVIILYTPDEYSSLHPSLCHTHDPEKEKNRWQPRPNVIFEAGMAFGISEARTILILFGNDDLPSDLNGRHFVRLNNSDNSRSHLRTLLMGSAVNCEVDLTKDNWRNTTFAGDFEMCFSPTVLSEVSTQSPFR